MLKARSYESYGIEKAANLIREDIALYGCSDGWKGYSLDVLADMEAALRSDGILYVDDMFGRWEHADAQRRTD